MIMGLTSNWVLFGLLISASVQAGYMSNCTRLPDPSLGEGVLNNQPDHNACDASAPYCRQINTDAFTVDYRDFGCLQCRHNCDCEVGSYCVLQNTRLPNYGTCQSYKHKLGSSCTGDLDATNPTHRAYARDRLCAIIAQVQRSETDAVPLNISVWQGVCTHGTCRECNSYLSLDNSPSVSISSQGTVVKTVGNAVGLQDALCVSTGQLTGNPYLGSPRICKNFALVVSKAGAKAGESASVLMMAVMMAYWVLFH